jgi:hypothetical protein
MAVEDGVFDIPIPLRRERVLPAPTDADFAWARANPGQWQHFVDPRADKSALEQANLMGGRLADDAGGFKELWLNPEFVPTRQSTDVDMVNEFELVLWRLIWGFNNLGQFVDALTRAEFIVLLPEDDPEGMRGWPFEFSGSEKFLSVYTSAGRLPKDVNPWLRRAVSGRDILEQVCPQESVWVTFCSDADDELNFPGADLLRWQREWAEHERSRLAAELGGE